MASMIVSATRVVSPLGGPGHVHSVVPRLRPWRPVARQLCHSSWSTARQQRASFSRGAVTVECKKGFRKRRNDDTTTLRFGKTEVNIRNQDAWQLAVPGFVLLVAAASIGPLVIGIAASALAVGVAASAGAVALTGLLFPLLVLGGLSLVFSSMTFSLFAGLGMVMFLSKVATLVFLVGGAALGWTVLRLASKGSVTAERARESPVRGAPPPPPEETEEEREARRSAAELREFDRLIRERERQRERDSWRS